MREFEYTITDELGIHARPAGLLVKKAGEFASTVSVDNGTKKRREEDHVPDDDGSKEGAYGKIHYRRSRRGRRSGGDRGVHERKSLTMK